MQNRIYLSSVLLAAASPALSQYNPAPDYSPVPSPAPDYAATPAMPSYTTQILTSALTVTSYLTVTSSAAQYGTGDIISPIEGLAQCSQTIIFDCLQDSKCNPADFPCICAELKAHDIEAKVAAACTPADKDQYLKFEADVCNNVKPYPVATGYPVASGYPVYSAAPQNTTVPAYNISSSAPAPVTVVVNSTATVGQPTTMQQTVVAPAPTGPATPEYTGAAAVMNVQNAMLAGGVGLMGLVFAGL
ncbi:hypothetical protein T440DRAFT_487827 [Plenodomus tracheiphilus IPT5]|uniref:Extracellular membrane protein CFEM domain-containing protein n=1 Tax=Plenodomus tracheiphilus IPT5 TaxID=1408161 RepID=A0A6A7BF29_9PLEO|nr:hypothetical protein T440DRAFT_487827 [Plenodomus tracheiphilus IPT5]